MKVRHDQLADFARATLTAAGMDEDQAARGAEILAWCDLVGRNPHGVWRLPICCKRVKLGLIRCPSSPGIVQVAPAACTIDGDNGFGLAVGALAMERAIALARDTGIAMVGVRNSNFFGAGAYYVNQAASAGMIGLAMSNSFPKVAAMGGRRPVLGTNPMAFGAPRRNHQHLLLDMATSSVAGSTPRKLAERNQPLPEGVAIDAEGRPITDPRKVDQGVLLPFGGARGYGLAVMVEILSGVLTGAGISDGVKSMYKNFEEGGHNGHFFVAVDIGRLMPMSLWYDRLEYLIEALRASGPDPLAVRYPGQNRWDARADNAEHGIELDQPTVDALARLAGELGVEVPW